jgi:hypothetical protein
MAVTAIMPVMAMATSAVKALAGTATIASSAATPVAFTTVASATLRALETGARIAADAGGVSREIFARSAAYARSPSFAGKKDNVIFDHGSFGDGLAG